MTKIKLVNAFASFAFANDGQILFILRFPGQENDQVEPFQSHKHTHTAMLHGSKIWSHTSMSDMCAQQE